MADSKGFIPLNFAVQDPHQMQQSAQAFYQQMATRRSVRDFSAQAIPDSVLEHAILAAGTAPSGANMQPWHFVVVQSPEIKAQIRQAAEKEERELYEHRASDEWLGALAPWARMLTNPFWKPLQY